MRDVINNRTVLAFLLCAFPAMMATAFTSTAYAHDSMEHCEAVKVSVADAGFETDVSVNCTESKAILSSTTYPSHTLMTGIVATNEQVPVPAIRYDAPVPLNPKLGNTPQTRDAALGIAVNGVPIYDYTGGGEMTTDDLNHYQARHDTLQTQQLDICGGHAGRGDDYHYHVKPTCMIEQMSNKGDDAIIGWAFDGFPIYGDNNPDGTPIEKGVLDVCNGQTDSTYGYRYHTSSQAPYIVQCLMGEVADIRQLPRVSPLKASAGGRGSEPGRPPRGGVQNLVFTQHESGGRSMEYTYEGEPYFIRYEPSETPECYNFETKTVTNNGEHKNGEFCR